MHDESVEDLRVPTGSRLPDFMEWVNQLPEREPPAYLGLPSNAEKLLLVGQGRQMIEHLGKVVQGLDEGEEGMVDDIEVDGVGDAGGLRGGNA